VPPALTSHMPYHAPARLMGLMSLACQPARFPALAIPEYPGKVAPSPCENIPKAALVLKTNAAPSLAQPMAQDHY
jgi:hypothetical protein